MPTIPQTSFNTGSLTPRLHGNYGLEKYASALAEVFNYVCQKQGPVARRPGTRFIAPTKLLAPNNERLQEFQFNVTQTYMLLFGPSYVRFFTNGGVVESSPGVPLEVALPYTDAAIPDLQFAQSADVLYIVHKDYPPATLTRVSALVWTYAEIDFRDGPYLDANTNPNNALSVSNASPVGSASVVTGNGAYAPFVASDVGRLIRFENGGSWGYVEITGFVNSQTVNSIIREVLPGASNMTNFRFGAWGTAQGYPSAVSFHQGRLWLAGGKSEESQFVNGSESDDFTNFAPTNLDGEVVDSNAIRLRMNTETINSALWLRSTQVLIVGTTGAEFSVQASEGTTLTPATSYTARVSNNGCAPVPAEYISGRLVFVQRSTKKLLELSMDALATNAETPDISIYGEHLIAAGIVDMAYQREPNNLLWMARADGKLVSFTYDRAQEVIAGALHEISGTDALVKSIAVIPNGTENRDEVWMIVDRTVDGSPVRYVETLTADFGHTEDVEDAFFVDCGLTYSGVPVTTVSGLDHLEGEEVQILADGNNRPAQTVSGGSVSVGVAASTIHVGLPYLSYIRTLTPKYQENDGATFGRKGRVNALALDFYRTTGGKAGVSLAALDVINFWNTSYNMDDALPLFTGIKEVKANSGWSREPQLYIAQDLPLPSTIRALTQNTDINDR